MIRNTHVLGAEELIDLGQAALPAPNPASVETAARTVVLSREEGELLVRVVENIVAFATDFPIEFHSYCPTDRWKQSLTQVGAWIQEIERQIKVGREQITVPAEALFRLLDLEKCVSAARDARLDAAKLAFALSAGGAAMDFLFGLSWVAMPMYVVGLGVLLGRPLLAKLNPEPQEPYKPFIAGQKYACAAGQNKIRLGDHTDKTKILERVILSPTPAIQTYHWGRVAPGFNRVESSICLAKDRFRVRVEGWLADRVEPASGWRNVPLIDCEARKAIAVWSGCGQRPRSTPYGPPPSGSGFKETLWIEYVGPGTGGICRTAGPFG